MAAHAWAAPRGFDGEKGKDMSALGNWATIHWIRFSEITTTEMLDLSAHPGGATSWKIGPDGQTGPDGNRLPSDVWCGVGHEANGIVHCRIGHLPASGRWRPGLHRSQVDRNKAENLTDRTLFTRFRALRTTGSKGFFLERYW